MERKNNSENYNFQGAQFSNLAKFSETLYFEHNLAEVTE